MIVAFEVVNNHFGKMMHIDDDLANSEFAQAGERDLQQRAPPDFHQGLGAIVGERSQARAQARSQHHGSHLSCFSNSIFSNSTCRSTTSTPSSPRKCFANCSAKNTERCWPPVQPNETVKLLKPRS